LNYKWVALSNTTLGALMSSLDTNIVIIALPTISRELRASPVQMLWTIVGYQVIIATFLINFGRLSDMFGRVKLYNLGFAVFTIGSALCSVSQNGLELVAFRMLQGIGAAFLFSNSAAILTDAFPPNERGLALGTNQIAIVVGSVAGLILGGLLTGIAGWRSIFWVNIPIGSFATIWAHLKLKELAKIDRKAKFDFLGNLVFGLSIVLVLLAITLFSLTDLGTEFFYIMMFSGLLLMLVFIEIERKTRSPMMDLSLFKIKNFTLGNIAIFFNALARGAITLVLTLYLQGPTMDLSPLEAGIYLTPLSVSLAVLGPISGRLSDKYGQRFFAVLGLAVSIVGFALLTQIGYSSTFEELLIPLIFSGAGMGIFASPNRASIMNSVPAHRRGIASGISTTLNNVGQTLSLGLSFAIMGQRVPKEYLLDIFSGIGTQSNYWVSDFIDSMHEIFMLSIGFLIIALIASSLRLKD
jgi:EmrB/QacA subfamily drug resistance transporter